MRIGCLAVLLLLTGCSSRFEARTHQNQIASGQFSGNVAVTFFGSSTLLIEDDETQILIDGFVTRYKHRYVRKIEPSEEQILHVLNKHQICPNPENQKVKSRSGDCAIRPMRGLSVVIPVHAHYDHALDSSYFAAWAGARLVADQSIKATFDASRKLEWEALPRWDAVQFIELFEADDQNTQSIEAGKFKITLLRSRHLENPLSNAATETTSDSLQMPAHLWEFGEGTNLSVRLEHSGSSMLIVPSGGTLMEEPKPGSLKSEVIFMGVGGLGWKSVDYREHYWRSLLKATDAERVIPIHWDSDQAELKQGDLNFALASPRRFDATLHVFERLAKMNNAEIVFAPPLERFDPFLGLK